MESFINLNNATLHAPFDYIEAPNAEYLKRVFKKHFKVMYFDVIFLL